MRVLSALSLLFLPLTSLPLSAENPFFAMDTIARGRPDAVVPLLKELGYDGLGGAAGDGEMAAALKAAGLRFFNGYYTINLDAAQPALSDGLRSVLDRMQGHETALWLAVNKVQRESAVFPKSSTDADELAVAKLREIAEYAATKGVRVALYPHTNCWIERVEDAVRVADKINRPDVGLTFNLCHWLKVEGSERDPAPVLKAALPRLQFVTINGADTGDTQKMGWDRLIQPLGSGTYDVRVFLKKVKNSGYTGPVGFQGYGIKAEPREVLRQTMDAWKAMNAEK